MKMIVNFLKEAIAEECNKTPQEIIDKYIDTFKPIVSTCNWNRISAYRVLLIINHSHRYISICSCKTWYEFDQLKKSYYNFSKWALLFAHPCVIDKITKLSKIDVSVECFKAHFL